MAVRIRPERAVRLAGFLRNLIDPPERVLDRLSLKEGEAFLDLGAGPGHHTIPAARMVGEQGFVTAVEAEPRVALELKRRVLERSICNVRILRENAETVVLERNTFDAALLCMVLHEIDGKEAALRVVWEAMKPGGRLTVVEFLPGSFWGPPSGHRVSVACLQGLLEALGFRDIRTGDLDRNRYYALAVKDS